MNTDIPTELSINNALKIIRHRDKHSPSSLLVAAQVVLSSVKNRTRIDAEDRELLKSCFRDPNLDPLTWKEFSKINRVLSMRDREVDIKDRYIPESKLDPDAREQAIKELYGFLNKVDGGPDFRIDYDIEKNPYRVGGMAKIFKGERVLDGKQVAIKLLTLDKSEVATHEFAELKERFRREWQILKDVQGHPNIVNAHEFFECNDQLMIVMDFVSGGNVKEWMDKFLEVDVEACLSIIRDICMGLAVLHSHGVVHRDLKPMNILLAGPEAGSHAMVADLGLAKKIAEKTQAVTSGLLGTGGYRSPEMIRTPANVDRRSDIYQVGLIAHDMLTGEKKPEHRTETQLKKLRPKVSPMVIKIIDKCLQAEPDNRWQNVHEIIDAIDQYRRPTVNIRGG